MGYDFLAFDRPLYFFNPKQSDVKENARPHLYRCGLEIPQKDRKNLKQFLENTEDPHKSARREIYAHAFGDERDPKIIKEEILKAAL